MRVLQLHYYGYEGGGGGSISFRRHHLGLRKAGVDSRVLCAKKTTDSEYITELQYSKVTRNLDRRLEKYATRLGLKGLAGIGSFGISKHPNYIDADLIHFHRIFGFISYLALPRLSKEKPAVLTLKDTWAFTGHCYANLECERWKTGCGKCPHLDIAPAVKRDNTRLEWKLKNWAYRRSNLSIVGTSHKTVEQAKQSMLGEFPIHYIPNGIDTNVYEPLDGELCREILGVPKDKSVLLFGAVSATNYIKGGDLLVKALQELPIHIKDNCVLLVFGRNAQAVTKHLDFPIIDLGYISNDRLKVIAFSCADLFLFPTRAEAFGNISLESLACGTPVVSFRVGGVPDQVRPGITGYLAEPEDYRSFRDGIVKLLGNSVGLKTMRENCRKVALDDFDLRNIVNQYIELYKQLVK